MDKRSARLGNRVAAALGAFARKSERFEKTLSSKTLIDPKRLKGLLAGTEEPSAA